MIKTARAAFMVSFIVPPRWLYCPPTVAQVMRLWIGRTSDEWLVLYSYLLRTVITLCLRALRQDRIQTQMLMIRGVLSGFSRQYVLGSPERGALHASVASLDA